jgi:hypothetical protein
MSIKERLLCSVAAPLSSRVSKKAVAFGVGMSLAACSLGGCAAGVDPFDPYPHGQSFYNVAPQRYDYRQRYVDPTPQRYADNSPPVARYNPATRRFEWSNMAGPAAVGAVGGMLANRALTGAETHAVEHGAETALERGAERAAVGAAERSVVTHAAESVAARGAVVAGAAEAAEAEEAEILLSRLVIILFEL